MPTFEFSRHSCPFRPKKKKISSLHSRNIWTTVLSTKYSWFVSYLVFLLLKTYAIKCVFIFTPFFVQKWSWRKFYRNRTEAFYNWKSEVVCVWLNWLISQRLRNFTVGEILEYLWHPSSQVHNVNIGQLLMVQVCVLQLLGKAASGQSQLSCERCLLFGLLGSHLNRVGSKGVVCLSGAEHRDL